MSDTDNKNEDKKVIADEEREKMLNEENEKESKVTDFDTISEDFNKDKIKESDTEKEVEVVKKGGEVEKMKKQIEESQKESKGGIRVPIGGIKIPGIPGFLRSRSRDKNKEADATVEEGADLLVQPNSAENAEKEDAKESMTRKLQKIKIRNPFTKKKNSSSEKLDTQEDGTCEQKEGKDGPRRLIDSLKIPLVSVLPRTFTRGNRDKDKDVEGGPVAEENGESKNNLDATDDGMETVKLDGEEKNDSKSVEKVETTKLRFDRTFEWQDWKQIRNFNDLKERVEKLSRHEKILGGVLLLLLLLIIIVASSCGGPNIPSSPPLRDGKYIATSSSCGLVEGILDEGIFKFRGIPYAVPPVGAKRWQRAEQLNMIDKCWNGTLKAYNNTEKTCYQLYNDGSVDGSEDCLTLDIFSPYVRYDSPVPVVVLIDSPTLVGGIRRPWLPTPNVTKEREILFVRPNFRLGVLGFLAAEPLSISTHPPSSGNYGLSDIIAALKWIKLNIVHFGGDPNLVTLVGHRAGATLVTALASSSLAKGLFVRAWASSGSAIYPGTVLQLTEQANQAYVEKVCRGDLTAECLRRMDVRSLIQALDSTWRPVEADLPRTVEVNSSKHEWLVLDGVILKENLWGGETPHARIVIGTTAHSEANSKLRNKIRENPDLEQDAVTSYVRNSHIDSLGQTEEALRRYNRSWEGLAAMVSDIRTVCPLLTFARAQRNITFYVSTFVSNRTSLGVIADVDTDISAILGHYNPKTEAEKHYVNSIQQTFFNYACTGELKQERQQAVLVIGEKVTWEDDYPNCNFWISKDVVPRFARRD